MTDAREARRRRLVERGGDRLAFITGQSRSFRKDDYLPPSPAGLNSDEVPLFSPRLDLQSDIQAANQISSSELQKAEKTETSRKEPTPEIIEVPTDITPKVEKKAIKTESSKNTTSKEPSKREPDFNRRFTEPSVTTTTRKAVDAAPPRRTVAPKKNMKNLMNFKPSEISASISATEDIRLICAVIIAIFVVFSYYGFSFGIGRILGFRPLFLVILTDITVVLAHLMMNNQAGERKEEEPRQDGDDWDIGKMLEALMLFQKASSAAVMDCSVCAVLMICGVAL